MSNYIPEEESIFAYRKLIDLLEVGLVTFFINYESEHKTNEGMGIYDISFIEILFSISNFLINDIEGGYLSIKLTTTNNSQSHKPDLTIKDGIRYLTDYYAMSKHNENVMYAIGSDSLASINKDYPNITKLIESKDSEFFNLYINLLYGIYKLEPSINELFFYDSGLGIIIEKGLKFKRILKDGAFVKNLEIPAKSFNRSLYGKFGNNLLSFNKQIQFVRDYIQKQFELFNINDIVINPQAKPIFRWSTEGKGALENDDRVRLLDCLFYLENRNEIKFIEILPTRIVIDATNLNNSSTIQLDEIDLNQITDRLIGILIFTMSNSIC